MDDAVTGIPLPSSVVLTSEPPAPGVPVRLTFHMSWKNDYSFVVFLGPDGIVRVEPD
jgi:hypothetical protein